MGLDIYAGTLTRYYANNWKNVAQQWAAQNGYTFQGVTPDDEEMNPAQVQEIVESWRDEVERMQGLRWNLRPPTK